MRSVNYSPFDLFEHVFDAGTYRSTDSFVEETKAHYFIQLDVPGFSKEDLTIALDGRDLLIEGERKGSRALKMRKVFSLPEDVDFDKIEARQKDGVLEVAVPKREQFVPKKILIQESKEGFSQKNIINEDTKKVDQDCCK